MPLYIEKYYPYIGGLVAAFAWWGFSMEFPPTRINAILSASLTLGAITTGFLATAKAILLSLDGKAIMTDLRKSGYIENLVSYLAQAIWLSFAFCILTLSGFFMPGTTSLPTVYETLWFSFGACAALAFARVIYLFLLILRVKPE